jgi:uncharacterized protein (TIGR00730 family)
MQLRKLAVFCGSSTGSLPSYAAAAEELGVALASRSIGLIYGGGYDGLMGLLAMSALKSGGEVTGILPADFHRPNADDPPLTELVVVPTIHDRKREIAGRADAFLALPGGSGTLEEILEQWTWSQIGIHDKPSAVLNVDGYYDPLIAMVAGMQNQGFTKPRNVQMLLAGSDVHDLLDRLDSYESPRGAPPRARVT